jgi:hypothetical protein
MPVPEPDRLAQPEGWCEFTGDSHFEALPGYVPLQTESEFSFLKVTINFIWVNPPALPEDSQSLIFAGAYEGLPLVNRSKSPERKAIAWISVIV